MATRESDLVLENYGGSTITAPVMVKELLLSLAGSDIPKTSVGIDSENGSGWTWLVYARNVYVWNFKDRVLTCSELPLPSSGLIHCARLCHVFTRNEDDFTKPPSFVCVSPEGCVRYWPKISQSSIYIDCNIELSGQVGYLVTALKGKQFQSSFILSTTTCNSFLLIISDGRQKREPPIQCIPLKASQNLISGIGRRVSSLIFATGLSAASSQEALVNVATIPKKGTLDTNLLYLLNSKCQIQCWQLDSGEHVKLLWEIDLRQDMMEKLASEIWNLKSVDQQSHPRMNAWGVDFVVTARRRFAVLAAIHDRDMSPHVYYGVLFFNEPTDQSSTRMDIFRLPFTRNHEPRLEESECNDLRLMCPFSFDGIFVQGANILVVSHDDQKKTSSLTLPEGDQIFGSGVNGDQFLVFTLENGLQTAKISAVRTGLPFLAELGDQRIELHQTRKSQEELEEMTLDEDRGVRFKAAFVYFLKQKLGECEDVLESLFSENADDLDALVVQLAVDIVDDYPASDPRWMHAVGSQLDQGGMVTRQKSKGRRTEGGSLLLSYQLDDKRKTMELFLTFLKSMKLRDRTRKYRMPDGRSPPTLAVLCELGEKLESCAAFVRQTEDASKELEKALRDCIGKIVREREEEIGDMLSVQDVFYRKVSEFHCLLPVFVDGGLRAIEKVRKQHDEDPRYAHDLLAQMADAILAILNTASKYRRVFERVMHWQIQAEMRTWLNSEAVRTALAKFYCRMADFMTEIVDTPGDDLVMAKHCRDLADLLLAECSLAPDRRMFERDLRRKLIDALIVNHRFDQARYLAEKYRDYGLLIEICEHLGDGAALESYKTKFRDDGFLEILYDYCIASGKPGRIFQIRNLDQESGNADLTARYLDAHRRTDLKWIFDVKMNQYEKASYDLLTLANQENGSVDKRKTLLSLAKLASLASDEPEESICLKNAVEGLVIVEHQKRLPAVAEGPPLSATELIEACILDPTADEWSFGRAIDLLASVCILKMPTDDYIALRTHIWALAILKDDWDPVLEKDDDLLVATSGTVFSRTLQLLCAASKDNRQRLFDQLATADELLQSEELQELAENPKFQYVLKAGEERILAWMAEETEKMSVVDTEDTSADENVDMME